MITWYTYVIEIHFGKLGFNMMPLATLNITSPVQALERLSIGEPIQWTRVPGLLDLDPLVVSRWMCGEDLRGVYQPIVLDHCVFDKLDLEGRTFYEMVEMSGCRITAGNFRRAYFYAGLLIEDCVFDGDFEGRDMQSDGRIVIRNTVFAGYANFEGIHLHNRVSLLGVSFPSGTNLLRALVEGSQERLEGEISLNGCRFCAADVPAGLETARLGVGFAPLVKDDLSGAKR